MKDRALRAIYLEYCEKWQRRAGTSREALFDYFRSVDFQACFCRQADLVERGGATHTLRERSGNRLPLLPITEATTCRRRRIYWPCRESCSLVDLRRSIWSTIFRDLEVPRTMTVSSGTDAGVGRNRVRGTIAGALAGHRMIGIRYSFSGIAVRAIIGGRIERQRTCHFAEVIVRESGRTLLPKATRSSRCPTDGPTGRISSPFQRPFGGT